MMSTLICNHCNEAISGLSKFCGNCGKKVTVAKAEKEKKSLQLVIAFYIVFLLYAIVSYTINYESFNLSTELALEACFILITLGFTLFDYKKVLALYSWKTLNWKNILFCTLFPVVTAFVVYYSFEWINLHVFEEVDNVFYTYSEFPNSVFWVLIFYTVIPPIFEELAFRGFLFNQLQNIANWQVTILATALIFSLVHFSFVSLLWIFPFGLVLGYLRWYFKTLWLGMLVHFIHNLIVVLLDYYYLESFLELPF